MKYHYLYKTTNIVTGKYYFGMHTTENLNDGYVGSGLVLTRSLKKYGKENHVCEILQMFDTREEVIEGEKTLITEDVINDPLCMNLRVGGVGGGGFSQEQQRENNRRSQQRQKWLREHNEEWVESFRQVKSESMKQQYKNGRKSTTQPHKEGKFKHSDQSKLKMSQNRKGKIVGNKNPNFGKRWITHPEHGHKQVLEDELQTWLDSGWVRGRKKMGP